ncbi:hypothetical protein [Guptibacillus hwajinpoensis]|uniref:Uncharacterized protein n=1 Tax=Guptibacillus hwajinpoensis TaxID=208199 RepID=A0ABU0K0X8_9BACL|nr:hypothetical protein [Alkalihalobacillus hemicentroti]MDQ0482989.1 hypothetical protein [Alkalihalobacillus hemicentroti]
MKKWAALLFLSLVVFSGYAVAPSHSQEVVQVSNYIMNDEDLPYCH